MSLAWKGLNTAAVIRLLQAAFVFPFLVLSWVGAFLRGISLDVSAEHKRRRNLREVLSSSLTYDDWLGVASVLDDIGSENKWRDEDASPLYDYQMIAHRLLTLRMLRVAPMRNDSFEMPAAHVVETLPSPLQSLLHSISLDARQARDLEYATFALREGLHRNLGNIGNPQLYARARVGTKHLIDNYINEVCSWLRRLAFVPENFPSEDVYSDAALPPPSVALAEAFASLPSDTRQDILLRIKAHTAECQRRLQFFRDTSSSYGKTALALSGGAALGVFSLGVCKALFQKGLLPKIISGSSVGSIIASLVCCRTDAELTDLFGPDGTESNNLFRLRLDAFEEENIVESVSPYASSTPTSSSRTFFGGTDRRPSLAKGNGSSGSYFGLSASARRKLVRLMTKGVLLDVTRLADCVRSNIGDMTFSEAFARTGRILNITVSSTESNETPRLLNYLTAPHVLIWSAACASCSIPGVFEGVEILAKDPAGRIVSWHPGSMRWSDGSLNADLPMSRLAELFNVNHFIVSQSNPHVLPFLLMHSNADTLDFATPAQLGIFSKIRWVILSEVRFRLLQAFSLGLMPKRLAWLEAMIVQPYQGSTTIVPKGYGVRDYAAMLSNPTHQFLRRWTLEGERQTWPKLARIRNQTAIERTMEKSMDIIEARIKCLDQITQLLSSR